MKNNWKEKVRNDYKDIISDEMIEDTIKYWEVILAEQKKELIDECITLSDLIESQNITVFDEWRAFKQFRNTLRDKLKHHD